MTEADAGPTTIEDAADPRLDPFRAVRDKDRRADGGRFVVEAPRVVSRFLDAVAEGGFEVEAVVLDPDRVPESLLHRSLPTGVPRHLAAASILDEAAGYRFHNGALAIGIRPRTRPGLDDLVSHLPDHGPVLLGGLAGLTSMDNIGGVFRAAAALGVDGLLIDSDCCDPLLRRCLRISMGQVFRVPWAIVEDLPAAISRLAADHAITSTAIENLPEVAAIHDAPLPERSILIIGNEGHGVPAAILDACDGVRRIAGPPDLPMAERPGGDDERSLNAHVAAAIAFHEARRGRPTAHGPA